MNVAVITARGGSKRIPRKNVKEFCGKPIIVYSIEAAVSSGCFDEVMVSTDDAEIAEIARAAGAQVPFMRSEATANDYATTADVLKEVLLKYKEEGKEFSYACCLYPTAPFITKEDLREAMQLLSESGAQTVMPVVRFSFPPQRAVIINEGRLVPQYPAMQLMRSQDLEPVYHDAGQYYCFQVDAFLKSGKIVGEDTRPVIISDLKVQDIDHYEDWKIAEMKYRLMTESK